MIISQVIINIKNVVWCVCVCVFVLGVILFTTEVQIQSAQGQGIDTCGAEAGQLTLPSKFFRNILIDGAAEVPGETHVALQFDTIQNNSSTRRQIPISPL